MKALWSNNQVQKKNITEISAKKVDVDYLRIRHSEKVFRIKHKPNNGWENETLLRM